MSIDPVSAGARAVFGWPGFSLEAGYLYDGERNLHKPLLSIQASLYFELYGAAGISIPDDSASWAIYQGLTHVYGWDRDGDFGVTAGMTYVF